MTQVKQKTLIKYKSEITNWSRKTKNVPMARSLMLEALVKNYNLTVMTYGYEGTLFGIETPAEYLFWRDKGSSYEFKGSIKKSDDEIEKRLEEVKGQIKNGTVENAGGSKYLFGVENIDEKKKELYDILKQKYPYVNVVHSTLGGDENISIMVTLSTEPKEDWNGGYIENSTYSRISIERNGTVERFSGFGMKLRKFKGKSIADVGKKINERIKVK